MRTDVDVDEACPEHRCVTDLGREEHDRTFEEIRVRPGEVDEVRGVDDERCNSEVRETGSEGLVLGRWGSASLPGRRVVAEDLEGRRADLGGPIGRPDHPAAERQVGAEASSVGQHRRHRSGGFSARVGRCATHRVSRR